MASWSFRHDLSKNLGSVSTRCRKGSIFGPRFFCPPFNIVVVLLLLLPGAAAAAACCCCSALGFRRGWRWRLGFRSRGCAKGEGREGGREEEIRNDVLVWDFFR
jgi:hypothetical protein